VFSFTSAKDGTNQIFLCNSFFLLTTCLLLLYVTIQLSRALPHLVYDLYALHTLVNVNYQDFADGFPLYKLAKFHQFYHKAINTQVKQNHLLLEAEREIMEVYTF
jgi:hypothetical protein